MLPVIYAGVEQVSNTTCPDKWAVNIGHTTYPSVIRERKKKEHEYVNIFPLKKRYLLLPSIIKLSKYSIKSQ